MKPLEAWAEECHTQWALATQKTIHVPRGLCEQCARAYAAEQAEHQRDALLAVYRGAKKMIDCLDAKGWQVARGHGMAFEDAVRETRNALAATRVEECAKILRHLFWQDRPLCPRCKRFRILFADGHEIGADYWYCPSQECGWTS